MSRIRYATAEFTFVACLTLLGTAAADPIVITSGHITVTGVQDLESRGFLRTVMFDFSIDNFRVTGGDADGPTQNVLAPQLSFPNWLSMPATLTPSGGSPEYVGLLSDVRVRTTLSLTPTPFVLTGTLSFFQLITETPLFMAAVTGTGTATWQHVISDQGIPMISGVRYEFSDAAPIPEPVTLLLTGAGLVCVAVRRKRLLARAQN